MKLGCKDCAGYKKSGHNYCRMCGFQLAPGYVKNGRVAVLYYAHENYCGYCGLLRHKCKC